MTACSAKPIPSTSFSYSRKKALNSVFLYIAQLALWLFVVTSGVIGDDWPRFRGPGGMGTSALKGVPTQWTENDYEWVIPLPGKGHSSPVLCGEHLFIGSGDDRGKRMLICLNATTGEQRWVQTLTFAGEHHLHTKNSYGSGTAATDGERVYVSFADNDHYQLAAFEIDDGSPVWTADLGPFVSQHGHGLSPIVFENLVIATNDQKGPSFVAAFDRVTGAEVWRTSRASRETSYATPFVLELEGRRPQLICLSGATGIVALDPHTGTELWGTGEMPMRTLASPVFGGGVVLASCGQGGRGKHMIAVEPPVDSQAGVTTRWERTAMLPYVPTPIISDEILYLWTDDGVVCTVDLKSGETMDRIRVGGTYSGSPVMIDGHLYGAAEDGEISVVRTNPQLEIVGKSPLGDRIHSSPAVGNGRVYFRGFQSLACLKAQMVD